MLGYSVPYTSNNHNSLVLLFWKATALAIHLSTNHMIIIQLRVDLAGTEFIHLFTAWQQ